MKRNCNHYLFWKLWTESKVLAPWYRAKGEAWHRAPPPPPPPLRAPMTCSLIIITFVFRPKSGDEKKGHHVRRCPLFHPKSSEEPKKPPPSIHEHLETSRRFEKELGHLLPQKSLLTPLPVSDPGHKLQKPSKESGLFQSLGTINFVVCY